MSIIIVPGWPCLLWNFRLLVFRELLWSGSTSSYHCLWSFNSLQRYRSLVLSCWVGEKYSISSIVFSLLLQVLLPFLKSKLDQFHRSYSHLQVQNGESGRELPVCTFSNLNLCNNNRIQVIERIRFLLLRAFLRLYPCVAASFTGVNLIYQLLFAFELTPFFNLTHRFLNIEIRRMTMQDLVSTLLNLTRSNFLLPSAGSIRKKSFCIIISFFIFLPVIVLPLAIFRFIHWILQMGHSHIRLCHQVYWLVYFISLSPRLCLNRLVRLRESQDRLGAVESLPIPPPPPLPKSFSGTVDNRCPLCSGEITNAACAPSGFVFCYLCLFRHVSTSPFCPITRAPCSTDNIRRLFDE